MGRKVFGVHFEGIGLDNFTGETNGVMWSTDPAAVPAGTGSYDWITANGRAPLMPEFETLNDTIDPLVAREEYSAQDLTFHAHDDVAERLLVRQTEAPYALTGSMDDATTTVQIGVSGLANAVLYIHEETIVLGAESGMFPGTYTNCDRAHFGSKAAPHATGSNVYTEQPFWAGRLVRSFTYDVTTGVLEERNRYRLSRAGDGPVIEQTMGQIVAHAVSVLADTDDIKINRESSEVDRTSHELLKATTDPARMSGVEVDIIKGRITDTTRVRKESLWTADNKRAVYLTGDVLFYSRDEQIPASRLLNSNTYVYSTSTRIFTKELPARLDDAVYEVFCVDRFFDEAHEAVSSTKDLDYPYHPLAIAAALIFSTKSTTANSTNFDVLQPKFSVDLAWLFDDSAIADIKALIEETSWMQIDQLLIGEDGSPVDVMRVIKNKLMRPWGFFFGLTTDGKMTVHRVSLTDINAYEQARGNRIRAIEGTLRLEDGRADVIDTIQCDVGGLPWQEPDTLYVRAVDGDSQRESELVGSPDVVLDFSTISRQQLGYVTNNVVQRALIQHFAIPRLAISANDWAETGNDYSLGVRCVLEDLPLKNAWLVDRAGTRIKTIDDDVQFTGQLYGRTAHPKAGWAFDLQMLFVGDKLVRHRAPSAVVLSYTDNGDGTSTLDLERFGFDGVEQGTESLGDDESYFTVGKPIQAFKLSMALRSSETPTITSFSGTGMELDDTFATAPVAGDIIEYAYYDSDASGAGYEADGLGGTYAYTARVYAALADDSETIGDDAETADIYGA